MQVEKRKVNELKYYPGNPRKMSDEVYERLKKSLQEFGYVEPLIVNKNNEVIGGNQRLKALRDLGVDEVEVVIIDLPKSKEKALNIALNKIQGEWDLDLLIPFIQDIEPAYLDYTGFSENELRMLLEDYEPIQPVFEEEKTEEVSVIKVYPKNEEEKEAIINFLEENGFEYERG